MILDATCGARQMWYQKDVEDVVYLDKRNGTFEIDNKYAEYKSRGNPFSKSKNIYPTIQADNRQLPFKDEIFDMVLFDPPHIPEKGIRPSFELVYGILNPITWTMDIGKAAKEGFRVLKPNGFFLFKWNERYAVVREALKLFPVEPLFGTHLNFSKHKTWWIVFRKD